MTPRTRRRSMFTFVSPICGGYGVTVRRTTGICSGRSLSVSQPRRRCTVTASAQPLIDHDPLARFSAELSIAHGHIEAAEKEFISASGAAEAASKEGVDIEKLSLAYGHVLSRDARKMGARLDIRQAGDALVDVCKGNVLEAPADMSRFETWLREQVNAMDDKNAMSKMYGYVIGRTIEASALELDPILISQGLMDGCGEVPVPFPMEEGKYDEQFSMLSGYAASRIAGHWESTADKFFDHLCGMNNVLDLDNDGFVLGIEGITRFEGSPVVTSDVVDVVLHGRFLDGRSFVVPTYSDGVDSPPDTIRIPLEDMPRSLRSGIVGMRVGQCRALFLHTYAAVEVVDLFGGADKFPPNVALVFDIYLSNIH